MAYDINAALERLENNLAKIDSARTQVENTVSASKALTSIVNEYVQSLNSLNAEVSSFIRELDNYQSLNTAEFEASIAKMMSSSNSIITSFESKLTNTLNQINSSLNAITSGFKSGVDNCLERFRSENAEFQRQIETLKGLHQSLQSATEEINTIKSTLAKLSVELYNSQTKQDNQLDNILSNINTIPSKLNDKFRTLESKVDNKTSDLKGHLSGIARRIEDTINRIKSIEDSLLEPLNKIDRMVFAIKNDLYDLKSQTNKSLQQVDVKLDNLKKIIIIAISVLTVINLIALFV